MQERVIILFCGRGNGKPEKEKANEWLKIDHVGGVHGIAFATTSRREMQVADRQQT